MAMSASKKKQEEEMLKTLREIASVPPNKQCFDCGQKGPTYLNMTIGAFVCTACSGLLRGLNPPQRVKSVSMASFTPEELEFIKSRGNDFCRKVWLGQTSDSGPPPTAGSRDDSQLRDVMSLRYEKKRWYNAPTEAMFEEARKQNAVTPKTGAKTHASIGGGANNPSIQALAQNTQTARHTPPSSSASSPKPVLASAHSLPTSPMSPPVIQPQSQSGNNPVRSSGFDLLADLGGDPFAPQQQQQQTVGNGGTNFANFSGFTQMPSHAPQQQQSSFQNTGMFSTTTNGNLWPLPADNKHPAMPSSSLPAMPAAPSGPAPQPAEKYSAIAEFEGVFGQGSGPLTGGGGPATSQAGGGLDWNMQGVSTSRGYTGGVPGGGGAGHHTGVAGHPTGSNPFGSMSTASNQQAPSATFNPFTQQHSQQQQQHSQQQSFSQQQPGSIFPQQAAFTQQTAFPQQPAGFPQQQAGFPQQQAGFPQQPSGFSQQGGFLQQQQAGFPQQAGYSQQPGFPQQSLFAQPPSGGFPQQSNFPQPAGASFGQMGQPSGFSVDATGQPVRPNFGQNFGQMQPVSSAGFGASRMSAGGGGGFNQFGGSGGFDGSMSYGANPSQNFGVRAGVPPPAANPFMNAPPKPTSASNPFL